MLMKETASLEQPQPLFVSTNVFTAYLINQIHTTPYSLIIVGQLQPLFACTIVFIAYLISQIHILLHILRSVGQPHTILIQLKRCFRV